jgi:aminoglycoside phosphotransferase (APT) family kinase protein
MNNRLREQLERYYRDKAETAVEISDFTAISDGWETEVYAFTLAQIGGRPVSRILRMYPGADAVEKSTREYTAMSALRRASGYPVPSVLRHESDARWLGKPFIVMQKIDGRPLGAVMIEDTQRQAELLTRFVQLFVTLHRMDYCRFVDSCSETDSVAMLPAMLTRWRETMADRLGQPWAADVLDWLDNHQADVLPSRVSPLHRDFHPNNVLITPDDQMYVIDWSGFGVGDYRIDLAWTLLLLSTQGYEHLRPIILGQYAQLSGHPVEHIEYFEVIAALRRLFDFAVSVGSGAASAGMRPETAAIMWGQLPNFRQVYALLQRHTGLWLPEIERLLGE